MSSIWPLITGTLTAIFAGVGVTMLILDRLQRITAEFDFSYVTVAGDGPGHNPGVSKGPSRLLVTVAVHNKTRRQIEIMSLRVAGVPLLDVATYDSKKVKRLSRNSFERSMESVVNIDAKEVVTFGVDIDWAALAQSTSSGTRKPSLRASVIIDCKTLIYPRRSFSATKRVRAETIAKNEAKAAQK